MGSAPAPPPVRSRWLTAYAIAVIAAGGAAVIHSLFGLPQIPNPPAWALLSVLAVVTASFALKVPGVPVYLSISDAFFIAAGLLFGPAPAALTIAADSLIVSARRKAEPLQLCFNVTSSALALWCGVHVFYQLAGDEPMARSLQTPDERTILPLACLAAVYFALNSGLTAVAVALSRGVAPWRFWRQHFAVMSVNYFAAASAAYFLILLVRHAGAGALAVVVPLLMVGHLAMRSWLGRVDDAQKHLRDVNRLYMSTISAFSTAIEAKDGVTSDHIHRVQAYAMGLAKALGVTDEPTLKAIEAAALLHDTGKLAIPEHILNKPGKLTAHEFETMKMHVDIGADILAAIDFPYPVVPIVRAHHEHWNGKGYPRGLAGEDIPIGARILSVVDCFDALTSDRPYRPALSDAAALEIVQQGRGTMYDPVVVDMFARVYCEIAPAEPPQPKLATLLTTIRETAAQTPTAMPAPRLSAASPTAAAPAELLAFVSLARLAAGTPTLADVGALADGWLRQLAPGATVALFGLERQRGQLAVRYVAGPAAAAITGLSVRLGDRLTGWVGANLLVGVLTLYTAKPLSDDQARMLEMIAPQLAAAIAAVEAGGASMKEPTRLPRSGMRVVASR